MILQSPELTFAVVVAVIPLVIIYAFAMFKFTLVCLESKRLDLQLQTRQDR